MEAKLYEFEKSFSKDTVALFYYAGHGVENSGENFLIAKDSVVNNKADLKYRTFRLNRLLEGFNVSENKLNVAILDACRDNPFRNLRNTGKGLATAGATGTLIAYATASGETAEDGTGENGLFTKHLLNHIDRSDVELEQMFKDVGTDVSKESKGTQNPWRNSSISGNFYLRGDGTKPETKVVEKEVVKVVEKVVKVEDTAEIERLQKQLAEEKRKREEAEAEKREAERKRKEAEAEKREAERKRKEAEAEKREAERKRKEAEAKAKISPLPAVGRNDGQNAREKRAGTLQKETDSYRIYKDVFVDKKTNLMWEKERGNSFTWQNAMKYCENLELSGYSNWRLPSLDETNSLLTNTMQSQGWYVKNEISQFLPSCTWISIKYNKNSSLSWIVGFEDGFDDWSYQTNGDFVVCVRDL
jgi:flagellar biosynthesis GTPase FlhF